MSEEAEEVQAIGEPVIRPDEEEDDAAFIPVADKIEADKKKWFGVPPVGKRSLPDKLIPGTNISLGPGWNYTVHLVVLIIVEILLWAVYRGITGPIFSGFGTILFYLMHIIFAPTIHLGPIIIYWKFIRKEPGIPFMFTRKNLFTGVVFGLAAGTLWRVFQFVIYDGLATASGLNVPGTFTFFNLMVEDGYWLNFALMTFVMYCIVGPVEEFEFRSFTLDQIWRGKGVITALVISSILFGCSHIPIAIFVYKFPPMQFVAALIGWIVAGTVLAIIYVATRNIWAAIVMHAVGNWTLSVMYMAGSGAEASYTATNMIVDIMTTLLADGLMFIIFLLIFKFLWYPNLMGKKVGPDIIRQLDGFGKVKPMDRSHLQKVAAILVVINVAFLGSVMAVTAIAGTPYPFPGQSSSGGGGGKSFDPSNFAVSEGESAEFIGEYANENSDTDYQFVFSPAEKVYLKSITITVTWTDEEDYQRLIRTWENAPDEFGISASFAPNSSEEDAAPIQASSPMVQNSHGAPGEVTLTLEIEHNKTSSTNGLGIWDITVHCGVCDDNYNSLSVVKYNDLGNAYDLRISTEIYIPE